MYLSTRSKEAIKTALAMTVSYGIALSMDWEKPMWAGFAVAFISLDTVGQSLNKGAMRMLGTLVAAIVALTMISWFSQDRWLFMLTLSLYVGYCAYRMSGSKHSYFWYASGFVCVIIALEAGPDSTNAFMTALQRAETTGLGILVYSLVSVFLWPSSTRDDFESAVRQLIKTQHELYLSCNELMYGVGDPKTVDQLKAQEIQLQVRFGQLLNAAETDSYEVWELRKPWRHFHNQVIEFSETMERWRESIAEARELDLHSLLPGLSTLHTELNQRLIQVECMLEGKAPEQKPQLAELGFDKAAVRQLSHFQMAALAVSRSRLQSIERLTLALFATISDIRGFGPELIPDANPSAKNLELTPDPDRLAGALRVIASMWLAFLAMIYINDIPGGVGFVIIVSVVGMTLSSKPQVSVLQLTIPAACSVLFAGILYIFIMPGLSSFTGLGLMIFLVTFAICYLFSTPRQAVGRAFGLALFVVIASITNEQSYHFLSAANTAMMFPMGFAVLAITAYFPISTCPEKVFLRKVKRFFNSCEYLTSTLHWDPDSRPGWMDRNRRDFHYREMSTLPTKMTMWAPFIETQYLPGTTTQDIRNLAISLQSLTLRMQELLEARGNPQAQFLVQELLDDVREWRLIVQRAFQRLVTDPSIGEKGAFQSRLNKIMDHLEARIQTTMDKAPKGELSTEDAENFYRLLGAYRGVSEALVYYAGSAGAVNWVRWREERFS